MLLQKKTKAEPFLRWLFIAEFDNGYTIRQTHEDKCFSRNDGTGSAFTDVLAHEGRLLRFTLEHINGKESAMVDLVTGNFMINGTPICVHNQFFDPKQYNLKLIYFRETRVEQDVMGTVQEDMSVKQENVGNFRHFVNRYFIGWETVVNGKNKQITLAVG